jgi:hypothetical protein
MHKAICNVMNKVNKAQVGFTHKINKLQLQSIIKFWTLLLAKDYIPSW